MARGECAAGCEVTIISEMFRGSVQRPDRGTAGAQDFTRRCGDRSTLLIGGFRSRLAGRGAAWQGLVWLGKARQGMARRKKALSPFRVRNGREYYVVPIHPQWLEAIRAALHGGKRGRKR